MNKLKNKRVLITAGAQGIGYATTCRLLESGCRVAVHTFSSQFDEVKLCQELGVPEGSVRLFQGDLRSRDGAKAVVELALEWLGGLDILINNAGSLIGRRQLGELETDFWENSVNLNVSSMLWVSQAAESALVAAGASSIVNLSSLAGRKGGHGGSLAYSSMKGAVLTFTRALAAELGPKGVRVNAVAPGLILGTSFHNTHTTEESARETIRGIPLGRAGNPDDVARAVLYLASEYDGFINGATLDINGGVYAC